MANATERLRSTIRTPHEPTFSSRFLRGLVITQDVKNLLWSMVLIREKQKVKHQSHLSKSPRLFNPHSHRSTKRIPFHQARIYIYWVGFWSVSSTSSQSEIRDDAQERAYQYQQREGRGLVFVRDIEIEIEHARRKTPASALTYND